MDIWITILKKAGMLAVAWIGGAVLVILVLGFITHSRADDFWAHYNASPMPVYLEDGWSLLWLEFDDIHKESLAQEACQKALDRYHASLVVLGMYTPEGEKTVEYFHDNIMARIDAVKEACANANH